MPILSARRRLSTSLAGSLVVLTLTLSPATAHRASGGYIDSINPSAATEPRTSLNLLNIGWYYTPTQSYKLDGIFSYFEPIDFGTGARTMTVQIQSDRPAVGGSVLAQGTFAANSATGGVLGTNFGPIILTTGTTYFVDFLGVNGMGINLGQWTTINGVHVATAGATTRLSGFYEDPTFSTARLGNASDQSNANGTASGAEPILFFDGTPVTSAVPEPSSLILLGVGMAGLLVSRRLFGRSARPEILGRAADGAKSLLRGRPIS